MFVSHTFPSSSSVFVLVVYILYTHENTIGCQTLTPQQNIIYDHWCMGGNVSQWSVLLCVCCLFFVLFLFNSIFFLFFFCFVLLRYIPFRCGVLWSQVIFYRSIVVFAVCSCVHFFTSIKSCAIQLSTTLFRVHRRYLDFFFAFRVYFPCACISLILPICLYVNEIKNKVNTVNIWTFWYWKTKRNQTIAIVKMHLSMFNFSIYVVNRIMNHK